METVLLMFLMGKTQLGALRDIAKQQAEKEQASLTRLQLEFEQLNDQHRELKHYAKTYQLSVSGDASSISVLLTHRMQFIQALHEQILQLGIRLKKIAGEVADCEIRWRGLAARHLAIQAVHDRRKRREQESLARNEQKNLEEAARLARAGAPRKTLPCVNAS